MNQTLQQTLVNATASAAAGATSAAIQGGDIGATALLGAAGGAAGTLAGIGAAELGAPEAAIPYAETAARVAAQGGRGEDIGMALGQQAVGDITRSVRDRPKDGPMTREELADATYKLLQDELAALEGKTPRQGVQVAEADMSDSPPLRIDITGVGDLTSEPREGGPDEAPKNQLDNLPPVSELSDAQLIDLVRAGQRRRQGTTQPAQAAPVEGEGRVPEAMPEGEEIEGEISDEEILELVRLGMDRAEGAGEGDGEEMPEGEIELGGGEGEGIPEGEMQLGGGEGEGESPVRPRVFGTPVVADRISRRGAASLTPRQVGQGYSAIVGDKEPTFGGDPGQQQDVWNIRSLRLRKALGL